jgi:hypothetical protein
VRRSPVPVIPFHGLRHTHASLLIANGIDAKVASERLGHSEFVFTVQTYQHTFPACTPTPPASSKHSSPRAPPKTPSVAKAG